METLLRCTSCKHTAPSHAGDGCALCTCKSTLEEIIEQSLNAEVEKSKLYWGKA